MSQQLWAILGGGVLGMTLAHRLAQAGRNVTLFEADSDLGGLASAWKLGDVAWDRHYHVTLLSDSHLRSLLRELELEQDMKWVQTRTGFFMDGQLYSMSNTLEFLRFPPLSLIDKLRLGATIFYASKVKDCKRLEKITAVEWLIQLGGCNVFKKMWLPLLRAKLGENYVHASAAFIWAIIARMYAARRSGFKKEMFGYLPGGYGRMLDRFGQVLENDGVEIQVNHAALRVNPQTDGGVEIEFASGQKRNFGHVVLTMPSPTAAAVCPALSVEEKAKLNALRYQGIICASVLLKKPLAGFYVTNLIDSWVPFTAVIEMTSLVDPMELGGNHLIYLPKYVDPDDPLLGSSDDEIRQAFLPALRRMYSHIQDDDVVAFKVSRVRRVLAISTLNYSANLAPMHASLPGVHIINSSHIANGTLNVNETVQLANAAADELLSIPVMVLDDERPVLVASGSRA